MLKSKKNTCSAVIVAAGASERFGSDKLSARLLGTPVLAYSISTLQCCEYIKEIVVVVSENKLMDVAELCDEQNFHKVTKIVIGGQSRLESALSGVCECDPNAKLIAIHDGARPLVTLEIIDEAIETAFANKAAIPVIPSRDTIKIASRGSISETPDREQTFCAQTPQVFDPIIIKGALTNALTKELTIFDDASAVEALGFPVFLSRGSEENIKITSPLDLKIAELILERRRQRAKL